MEIKEIIPPRAFEIKCNNPLVLKDCAHIHLEPHEQITLTTNSGSEYDIARMPWGYYATPSLNSRLQSFGLRGLLIKSQNERFYVFLVEKGKEDEMNKYIDSVGHEIVCWLDSDAALNELTDKVRGTA